MYLHIWQSVIAQSAAQIQLRRKLAAPSTCQKRDFMHGEANLTLCTQPHEKIKTACRIQQSLHRPPGMFPLNRKEENELATEPLMLHQQFTEQFFASHKFRQGTITAIQHNISATTGESFSSQTVTPQKRSARPCSQLRTTSSETGSAPAKENDEQKERHRYRLKFTNTERSGKSADIMAYHAAVFTSLSKTH